MEAPKDRANDPKRQPKKEEVNKEKAKDKPFSFRDDPSSRNTGWFFHDK